MFYILYRNFTLKKPVEKTELQFEIYAYIQIYEYIHIKDYISVNNDYIQYD